jgi:ketosteroid isomerase-like protein
VAEIEGALRQVAHPDVECVMFGPDPRFPIEARGVQAFIEAWRDWLSPFDRWRVELENVIELDDRVVTLVHQFAQPPGSEAEVENAGGAVWFMREGRLSRVEFHLDRQAALRAGGVSS